MDIVIDKNQNIPLYIQIYDQIKMQIITGEIKRDYKLMPERKLALKLDINRSTVLNAYNKLKSEGFVESKVGQGTIVTSLYSEEKKKDNRRPAWNQIFNSSMDSYNQPLLNKMLNINGNKKMISFAIGIANSKYSPKLSFDKLEKDIKENLSSNALFHTPLAGN